MFLKACSNMSWGGMGKAKSRNQKAEAETGFECDGAEARGCPRCPGGGAWRPTGDCAIVPPMTKSHAMVRLTGSDCSKKMGVLLGGRSGGYARGWLAATYPGCLTYEPPPGVVWDGKDGLLPQ